MDYVIYVWKHHIWINERILSNGKESPTNNYPPLKGCQKTPKNLHYMAC